MPWYLLMVGFLGVALKHIRPTPFQLLLLGGVYEMMSDGLLGSSLGGNLVGLLVLSPVIYPLFTIVYSPIVLVPTLACWPALERRWRDSPPTGPWYWAFFPCLAILPYAAFLITLLYG